MPHQEHTIEAADGINLFSERWLPDGDPKFVVVVAHGGAEHVGRYAGMAKRWNAAGGLVIGADHRGQGKSEGSKGHVDHFETFARDLRTVIDKTAADLPASSRPDALPWFLFAHSMGGLIGLVYLLDHEQAVPLRGAMISAPLIEPAVDVGAVKRFAANVLMTVAPKVALPTGIPADHISRDSEAVAAYVADTRRVDVLSAGWLRAMLAAVARVEAEVQSVQLPMRWYLGTGDKICNADATRRVFRTIPEAQAKEREQTLLEFDGYYHELHNEPEALREPILAMLDAWIAERL